MKVEIANEHNLRQAGCDRKISLISGMLSDFNLIISGMNIMKIIVFTEFTRNFN